MIIDDKTLLRFMNKVKFFEPGKCWEWTGYIRKDGYANFWVKNKVFLAHRFSYLIAKGDIPRDMSVCHSCDNPKCINPDHLWLGTHAENMKDCAKKGRIVNPELNKKHCKRNHPLFGDNLRLYKDKSKGLIFRKCRACDRIRARKYREHRSEV